jgi:hypothetical protein
MVYFQLTKFLCTSKNSENGLTLAAQFEFSMENEFCIFKIKRKKENLLFMNLNNDFLERIFKVINVLFEIIVKLKFCFSFQKLMFKKVHLVLQKCIFI